nr:MAG TPA: Cytosine specific methyltransferase [Caudoviricetes sp.]
MQLGNIKKTESFGGNPQCGRIYSTDGLAPCLNTMQGGQREPKILIDGRVRKLTPRECWRLQGFPDWAFDKAQEVNSNSQLYKQAGNSVTVNVIEAIANKIETEGN